MNPKRTSLLIASLLASAGAYGELGPQLFGQAQAATVEIGQQADGRRMIDLPDLEFPLRVDAGCAETELAGTMLISIADTFETHDAPTSDTSLAGTFEVQTVMLVPSNQVAPIAIERFCTADNNDAATIRLIPAAFAANISFRCTGDNSQSIQYARVPLEIKLVCKLPENVPGNTVPAQESSPAISSF